VAHRTDPLDPTQTPKHHYNLVIRIGIWVTVITAAIWTGGALIKTIERYLPYALGTGVFIMAIGLFIQYRKSKATIIPGP
jgi:hypothetical protein